MVLSLKRPPRQGGSSRLSGTITLAFWQLRLTWRLLLVAGTGVVAAVILVCSVPLYSQVAMSAGLRDALREAPDSAITVHSVAHLISQPAIQQVAGQIEREVQENLGPFLADSQFSIQSTGLQIGQTNNQVQLIGWSMKSAQTHVKMTAGRLPADGSNSLETAITPDTAEKLHLEVGSTVQASMLFLNDEDTEILESLTLQVVGIFSPLNPSEDFWHRTSFLSQPVSTRGNLYPVLVSNNSYISVLEQISDMNGNAVQDGINLEYPTDLYWYYNLDINHLDINHLDALANGLNNVLVVVSNQPVDEPFIDKTTSNGPADLVDDYDSRIAVANIPLLSLAYLIAGLMLFFVSLMTDLLVDRQSEAIAILRSRGASRHQIFSALIVQSIGVGIIAFLVGPLLAVLVARLLGQLSLPAADQGALNVILADPVSAALSLYLAALATVAVSILAMVFAMNRASRMDVLTLRQESARTTRGVTWLRMGLDILSGVIALTGYGFSVYITTPGVLDARTRVLILPPMTLVGAVFLLLGCMLLFLRIFPFILEVLSNLAVRNRGVASILAVAQMARAPRQSLRMTLLLALAVAFGIFSLVFSASQEQRIPSVAAYEVGADFSGVYASGANLSKKPLSQQEAAFKSIPGVLSSSVGYTSSTRGAESGVNVSIELRAVDSLTFAQTGLWSAQDSSDSLSSLMTQLRSQSQADMGEDVVPAIVDSATWQALSLTSGASFTLSDLNGTINYIAIGEVNYIPTVIDSAEASGTDGYVAQGGVLVDFAAYQAAVQETSSLTLAPSTVWLSTRSDPSSLASVRTALGAGPLSLTNVTDLFALESSMNSDPLYLALLGVLALGTATALLLGLLGNMTISWLSARSRVLNFAVMRALGTAPGQIASILTYEQLIIYATAIGLGVAFGLLLSFLVLPAFVFTSSVGNVATGVGIFYLAQSVPPIRMIVPGLVIALAIGTLVGICVIALGMMVRIVSRPALSGMLRLNGD